MKERVIKPVRRGKTKVVREPIAAPDRYRSARRAFASDAELADLIGVHRSNVVRWKQGERASSAHLEPLLALDVVVSLLDGFLAPAAIRSWLYGLNALLADRRPLDVLKHGRLSEVVAAIEAEKQGAFA